MYPNDICSKVLLDEKEIEKMCTRLGKQIQEDYEGKPLTLVCCLKGAFMFFEALVKHINSPCQLEFIKASSYVGDKSEGEVKVTSISNFDIKGRDILIVEDIVDTGKTCVKLFDYFKKNGCHSVNMCVLLDKKARREVDCNPKYVGFEIENEFVIGFGLDYNELYRNLPYIGIINPKYI